MPEDNTQENTDRNQMIRPSRVRPSEGRGGIDLPRPRNGSLAAQFSEQRARISAQADGGSCPTCGPGGSTSGPPSYVYALGTIKMRFPSPSVEKEFAQVLANGQTANLTDQQVLHTALTENRYLANEVCWVFTVENTEAYILVPRDTHILDQFVNSIAPSTRGLDVDVIVGTRGPVAPIEMCGLAAPMVLVDQSYSFDRPRLLEAIRKPPESAMSDDQFRNSSEELFDRIQQLADNVGATDEHRALNYLAVRYQQLYAHTSDMYGREFSLTAVEVIPSRLSATRKLVNVVFTYTNRGTDVSEKYSVRVDVTEKFPFLDKKLSPYYDRE